MTKSHVRKQWEQCCTWYPPQHSLETQILLLSSIEETASRTRKIPSATRVKVRLSDVVAAGRNTLKYTKTIKTGKPQLSATIISQFQFGERFEGKETRLLSELSHVNMKASLAAIACVLALCLQALLVQEIDAQGGRGGFVEGARGDRGLRVVREANRPPPPGRRAAGVDFSDLSPGEVEKPDLDLLPGVRPRSDRRPRDVRAEKFESRQNGVTHGRRSSDGLSDRLPGETESPDLLPGVRQRGKNEKGPPNPGNHWPEEETNFSCACAEDLDQALGSSSLSSCKEVTDDAMQVLG